MRIHNSSTSWGSSGFPFVIVNYGGAQCTHQYLIILTQSPAGSRAEQSSYFHIVMRPHESLDPRPWFCLARHFLSSPLAFAHAPSVSHICALSRLSRVLFFLPICCPPPRSE